MVVYVCTYVLCVYECMVTYVYIYIWMHGIYECMVCYECMDWPTCLISNFIEGDHRKWRFSMQVCCWWHLLPSTYKYIYIHTRHYIYITAQTHMYHFIHITENTHTHCTYHYIHISLRNTTYKYVVPKHVPFACQGRSSSLKQSHTSLASPKYCLSLIAFLSSNPFNTLLEAS